MDAAKAKPAAPPQDSFGPSAADQQKLQIDLLKFQAEEYQHRYESMRSLEWKVLFQIYAGYTAIALAFRYLSAEESHHPRLLAWLAVVATSIFYLASRYLGYRIQERLIRFDEASSSYIYAMQGLLGMNSLNIGTLGHQYYWTYDVQMVLSTATFVGLLIYESANVLTLSFHICVYWVLLCCVLLLTGFYWIPVPRHQVSR